MGQEVRLFPGCRGVTGLRRQSYQSASQRLPPSQALPPEAAPLFLTAPLSFCFWSRLVRALGGPGMSVTPSQLLPNAAFGGSCALSASCPAASTVDLGPGCSLPALPSVSSSGSGWGCLSITPGTPVSSAPGRCLHVPVKPPAPRPGPTNPIPGGPLLPAKALRPGGRTIPTSAMGPVFLLCSPHPPSPLPFPGLPHWLGTQSLSVQQLNLPSQKNLFSGRVG